MADFDNDDPYMIRGVMMTATMTKTKNWKTVPNSRKISATIKLQNIIEILKLFVSEILK